MTAAGSFQSTTAGALIHSQHLIVEANHSVFHCDVLEKQDEERSAGSCWSHSCHLNFLSKHMHESSSVKSSGTVERKPSAPMSVFPLKAAVAFCKSSALSVNNFVFQYLLYAFQRFLNSLVIPLLPANAFFMCGTVLSFSPEIGHLAHRLQYTTTLPPRKRHCEHVKLFSSSSRTFDQLLNKSPDLDLCFSLFCCCALFSTAQVFFYHASALLFI